MKSPRPVSATIRTSIAYWDRTAPIPLKSTRARSWARPLRRHGRGRSSPAGCTRSAPPRGKSRSCSRGSRRDPIPGRRDRHGAENALALEDDQGEVVGEAVGEGNRNQGVGESGGHGRGPYSADHSGRGPAGQVIRRTDHQTGCQQNHGLAADGCSPLAQQCFISGSVREAIEGDGCDHHHQKRGQPIPLRNGRKRSQPTAVDATAPDHFAPRGRCSRTAGCKE